MDLVTVATHPSMDINQIEIQMHTKDCQHVKRISVGTTTNIILSRFFVNNFRPKLMVVFCYSQTSSPTSTDNWDGFESKTSEKRKEYKSDNSASRKSTQSVQSPDFDSFDVKSSKPKTVAGKTKKVEDDAWDLLNN